MATPRKTTLPPPQIDLVDGSKKINRYWLDWFDNADRVIVRTERSGSEADGDTTVSATDRLVTVDASNNSIVLTLQDPTGQNFDFLIKRTDTNWGSTVALTVDGVICIDYETTQYLYPLDGAHIQAMSDAYWFV